MLDQSADAIAATQGAMSDAPSGRASAGRFLAKRVALGILTLFAVSVLVFLATQALPSDPARTILGKGATPESLDALRQRLGLNDPLVTQYTSWLRDLLTGDFGSSIITGRPVNDVLGDRLTNSLTLVVLVAVIALPLSFGLGVVTGLRQGGRLDRTILSVAIGVSSVPDFVIATTLVILFATVVFQFLPAVALIAPGESPLSDPAALVLPVTTLVLLIVPYLYRLVRNSMIEALGTEYVAMARLKGMPPRIVMVRHALRNALLPGIHGAALVLGSLLASLVIVETVFQYPGIGSTLVQAVAAKDVPVIQAIVLISATGIILFNLMADALTIYLTPKLRTSFAGE